jgi:sugar lactone lactonase YvrE
MIRKLAKLSIVLAVGAATFLFWPPPQGFDPVAWEPLPAPVLSGDFAENLGLTGAERLAENLVLGPEDLSFDATGRIYGGTADGKIVRLQADGTGFEVFATTGGRPLGLHFDAKGALIVCDADKGLLSIDPQGRVEVLSNIAGNRPFRFTDDVDIASDGRIYFSDASSRWDHHHYLFDLLEGRPWGRLLRFDPATRQTEVLLDDLYFANGVALSQNEDFVLVNETYRYRITRYWLKGERAGQHEIFLDNLPGIPDGVSANRRGTFWIALFTPRNARADFLASRPFLKRQIVKLPRAFWPKPERHGIALAVDENGQVQKVLHEPTGERVPQVTSVQEHEGWLYLGNLTEPYLSRVKLEGQP